ncbi:hypothetical protein [Psychromonas sp. MME2]|uniref:hypothetical protein n=1 Tax=Psychromonas sp. MME2 TaxID=3231033 RepID=UPI00339C81B4
MSCVYLFDARESSIAELYIVSTIYKDLHVIVKNFSEIEHIRSTLKLEGCNAFAFITSDLELSSLEILYCLFEISRDVYIINENSMPVLSEFSSISNRCLEGEELHFMEFLSCFTDFKEMIRRLNAPIEIGEVIIRCLNSLENIANLNMQLMYKGSFLNKAEIHNRENDTCFDNICLKEFVEGEKKYREMFESQIVISETFKIKKLDFFNLVNAVRPSNSNSIQLINGYPVVYKLYSSYLFECAKIKKNLGFISSSFMYFFKSLETYCDGFLIYAGLGEINDYYNKKGELKRPDALLVNGSFIPGLEGNGQK